MARDGRDAVELSKHDAREQFAERARLRIRALSREWEKSSDTSSLAWDKAKPAAQDAWSRVQRFLTGDAEREFRQVLGADSLPPGGKPTLFDGQASEGPGK